ncbi:MAG: hypothetical protein D6759_13885 [Chloroflexi bacterium]|nr:MAG: hypothetical protein D6759_13885 [Chloroflexota bacterium]
MEKHPSEIFGYPVDVHTSAAEAARRAHRCPFSGQKCNKKSRLLKYPMGVCSVQYGDHVVAICPRRFLQEQVVFLDVADQHFGTRDNLLLFQEVRLPTVGSFDFVMVKHKPLSSQIEDFVIIEIQTDQTTGTGQLVQALEDFLQGETVVGRTYSFGLNTYDTLKRSFTQILNKGVVLEQWGQKAYWVFQEPVYRNFVARYNLGGMTYDDGYTTVFLVYDLTRERDLYRLTRTRKLSASTEELLSAFRNSPGVPSKDDFVAKLEEKIRAQLQLKVRLQGADEEAQ